MLDDDDDCPFTDLDETVDDNGCSEGQLSVLDDDNDGVSNLNDLPQHRCERERGHVGL